MTTITDIRNIFFDSLKRGTGEAYLLLKENPQIDFSDLIIKGATTNFAYDRQSEGSRANYIYRLIIASKQKDKTIKSILAKLQAKKSGDYGLDQMCDLAVKFHKTGNKNAKSALTNRFLKNNLEEYEFCGQRQMMEIDGVEAVIKVAKVIGKTLIENPDDYEDSWRVDEFQKRNKAIDIYKVLKDAASEDKLVRAYYDSIIKNKWKLAKHRKIKRFTYEIIKDKIDNGRFMFLSSKRSNELTISEVEKLANEFIEEKNNKRKELYLSFFGARKFPFDYKPIFKIASGRNPRNSRLVDCAVEALKYFKSSELRQLAIQKLKMKKNTSEYLNLLVGNYEKGDNKLLCEIANRSNDYDYIHSIVFGFIEIYNANPTDECKEPLEIIYNKMNCGIHREDIVKILIDNKVISDEILKEIEFDSDDNVRKLYRKMKKQQVTNA